MFIFVGYLTLTLATMFAAYRSKQDDLEDLAGILFVSWISTNIVWSVFPHLTLELMLPIHVIQLCACLYFSHKCRSKYSAYVAAGFVAMMINHWTGTPGEYGYHLTQNLEFIFQCMVVLVGAKVAIWPRASNNKAPGSWTNSQPYTSLK